MIVHLHVIFMSSTCYQPASLTSHGVVGACGRSLHETMKAAPKAAGYVEDPALGLEAGCVCYFPSHWAISWWRSDGNRSAPLGGQI
jgi:hypothetical protein